MSVEGPRSLIPVGAAASPRADHDHVSVRLFGGELRIVRARFPDGDVEREHLLSVPLPTLSGPGDLRWDVDAMLAVIREALRLLSGGSGVLRSVSVEGFGADYALVDSGGERCWEPRSHQSPAGHGDLDAATALVDARDWYLRTGVPLRSYHSAPRWLEQHRCGREPAEARTLLLLPDLLRHALGGELGCERSGAASTNLLNASSREWDRELVERLGLEPARLPPLVETGKDLGALRGTELGAVHVVATPGDELVAAITATPAEELFVRSGSFARIGVTGAAEAPNAEHAEHGLFHTAAPQGRTVLHQEVSGTFLLEEIERNRRLEGRGFDPDWREALKIHDADAIGLLRLDHPRLQRPLSMLEAVRAVLAEARQPIPETDVELARTLLVSMICEWCQRLDRLAEVRAVPSGPTWVLGSLRHREEFLRALASASGRELRPGTGDEMGGLLVQAVRDGRFRDLDEARAHLAGALPRRRILPVDSHPWTRIRARHARLGVEASAATA